MVLLSVSFELTVGRPHFPGLRAFYPLAVAAIFALGHPEMTAALPAAPLLDADLANVAAGARSFLVAAAASLDLLGAGIVATTVTPAMTASIGERRSRDRQCRSTGRKHPNAHGKSPFNERKRLRNRVVPPFIRSTGSA
jgi:hypothetical protein